MSKPEYQRVGDADDVDDGIVVRIRRVDGELVAEADHPTIEHAPTGRLIVATLGNATSVTQALANAQRMRVDLPMFQTIFVQIEDENDWQPEWGDLLPAKLSSLISKPFR
nr:hypothetical protein [Neorhizobium tomejilense]